MANLVRIDGSTRLRRKLERLPIIYKREVMNLLDDYAKQMIKVMRKSIRDFSGAWKFYRINGKDHWSAPPGMPPNKITGDLARSIKQFGTARQNDGVLIIGSDLDYALYLEFGTRDMDARPFIRPVFRKFSPQLTKDLAKVIKKMNKTMAKV
jgi:HK97 gp10 family phage protein